MTISIIVSRHETPWSLEKEFTEILEERTAFVHRSTRPHIQKYAILWYRRVQRASNIFSYYLPVQQHFSSVLHPVVDGVGESLHVTFQLYVRPQWCPQELIRHFDHRRNCDTNCSTLEAAVLSRYRGQSTGAMLGAVILDRQLVPY